MILAIDIHYKETYAKAVCVAFDWADETPKKVYIDTISEVEPYIPGEFYKRELPCVLKVLAQTDLDSIEAIIVDGHVFVHNDKKYGLGGYLWEALDKKAPIIGVAKKSFINTEEVATPILRGSSENPLYVSCIGIDKETVLEKMKLLHGEHRMPTILKLLDTITKTEMED
ncbi:endonuclease V [Kordia sp. YSTF-M3]|uniref:Endonuclease V n=1 Tax=Kordia aestuariivivens TaxID=2759037 RepID=A0ABR7QD98_9FLAO|nr:endonuclease V [Kordia aestuariivivens]MBC8756536.1 endonuclease V [Kordia aestuariivivens]